MSDTVKDLAVYVLLRTDLPSMNSGKAAAQVHHAGVQMMSMYHTDIVAEYINTGLMQGAAHFNTTIVLGATEEDIRACNLKVELSTLQIPHNGVVDPSYPFFVESMEIANLIPQNEYIKIIKVMDDGRVLMVRNELTCAWYLGDRSNPEFTNIFQNLRLHP